MEKLKIEKDQLRAEHEQNTMEAAEKQRAVENELNIRISVGKRDLVYMQKRDLLYRQKRPTDTGVTTRRCK